MTSNLMARLLQLLRLVAKRHPAEAIHEAVGKVQAALQAVSAASTLSEQVLLGMLRSQHLGAVMAPRLNAQHV